MTSGYDCVGRQILGKLFPDARGALQKISNELSSALERVSSKEKYLSTSFSHLVRTAGCVARRCVCGHGAVCGAMGLCVCARFAVSSVARWAEWVQCCVLPAPSMCLTRAVCGAVIAGCLWWATSDRVL